MQPNAHAAPNRTLLLSVPPGIAEIVGGVLGGGAAMRIFDRWWLGRRKKAAEPVQLTARILDDGDKLRELLLSENKELRAEKDVAVERAHAAELKLARSEPLVEKLTRRLTERDAELKALQNQLAQHGLVPVVAGAPFSAGGSGS